MASTDGVGTKLAVAIAAGRLGTIGVDLVAMCVDDLVCQGAEPLFFLDYQLWGHLDPDAVAVIMSGVADGCRQAGCAILGGELAEHPGQLPEGEMDLAGFAVGVVEKDRLLGPGGNSPARPGDVLVGIQSGGLRCNGYSLVRAALLGRAGRRLDDEAWPGAGHTLADELLRPSLIYAPAVLALVRQCSVGAVAHITGGGLPGNLPRALPAERRRRPGARELACSPYIRRGPGGQRGGRGGDGTDLQHGAGDGRQRASRPGRPGPGRTRGQCLEADVVGRVVEGAGLCRFRAR